MFLDTFRCKTCGVHVTLRGRRMHAPVCPDLDCRGELEQPRLFTCEKCGKVWRAFATTEEAEHCDKCGTATKPAGA